MTEQLVQATDASAQQGRSSAEVDAAWARVQLARHPQRPRTLDLIPRIFDDFFELHGDRAFRDDPAIVGGPALLDGKPVMVIGHQKGTDTDSNIFRNFGSSYPEGFRKAQRLMQLADKLGLPLITFLDTAGAFPGPAAEERGQAEAIAASIKQMIAVEVPIVTVVLGEGGSGGALAIGIGDEVLALENSVYSVISPEGCASILWRSPDQASTAAAAMRMTASDQRDLGVVDAIIGEPEGGAQADVTATARAIKAALLASLARLTAMQPERLLSNRYARLREIGKYREAQVTPRIPPEPPSLRRRLGRLLGAPRRPRWSEIWPSGNDAADTNNDSNQIQGDG